MKQLKYLLILPLLLGCNSKNNSIEVLKANAQNYSKTANTYAYKSKSIIGYFRLNKNKINIKIIEKNQNDNIDLTECKVSKTIYTPTQIDNPNDKGKFYTIILKKSYKNLYIKCKLSNNETIKLKMRNY